MQQGHGDNQDDGPEAEHHFDLAEEVKQPGVAGKAMGNSLELLGGEGVAEGHHKDGQADELNG